MRPGRTEGGQGFGLVELLVSLLLLAVGILALLASVQTIGSRLHASYLETQVRARAQSTMEDLLADGPVGIASGRHGSPPLRVEWDVVGGTLKEVRVVARQSLGELVVADTFVTLVRVVEP